MEVVAAIVVGVISAVSGGFAIPIGFSLGLSPVVVYLSATIGSLIGLMVFLYAGDKIRSLLPAKRETDAETDADADSDAETEPVEPAPTTRARHIIERFGARGLGLIGPIFPGVTGSVVIGLGMGLDRSAIAKWMSLGIAVMFALYVGGLWLLIELIGVE